MSTPAILEEKQNQIEIVIFTWISNWN